VLAFGTTLVLARLLGAQGYGVIALALAVGLYLAKASECGLEGVGVKAIAGRASDPVALASAVSTMRLVGVVVLFATSSAVAWFALPDPERLVLPLSFLALFPIALDLRWVLIGLEDAGPVAGARVAGELVTLAVVLALVRDGGDLAVAVLSYAAGLSVTSALVWTALRQRGLRTGLAWHPQMALPLLKSGLPIAGQILLGLFIFNADLFFLRWFVDGEAVGLYAAAYAPFAFLLSVAYAHTYSVLPVLVDERNRAGGGRQLYADQVVLALNLAIPVAAGAAVLATPIMTLGFGAAYAPSGQVLAVLIIGAPFAAITALSWTALTALGRSGWLLGATALAALLNVLLNVLLIPRYGMAGAAIATVATEAVRAGVMSEIARRGGLEFPRLRRLVPTMLVTGAMVGVLLGLDLSIWIEAPLGGGLYLVGMFALDRVRVMRSEPRAR